MSNAVRAVQRLKLSCFAEDFCSAAGEVFSLEQMTRPLGINPDDLSRDQVYFAALINTRYFDAQNELLSVVEGQRKIIFQGGTAEGDYDSNGRIGGSFKVSESEIRRVLTKQEERHPSSKFENKTVIAQAFLLAMVNQAVGRGLNLVFPKDVEALTERDRHIIECVQQKGYTIDAAVA